MIMWEGAAFGVKLRKHSDETFVNASLSTPGLNPDFADM